MSHREPAEEPQERAIAPDERSGVLHPANLERYAARWFEPGEEVGVAVERYWHVHWRLGAAESISQQILTSPLVTLSIEVGEVPARFIITGVHRTAWVREIQGSGEVFGIRLRPAGLALLSDLRPEQIADATIPITPHSEQSLHALLTGIATESDARRRATLADRLIAERIESAPVGPDLVLANAVLDELTRGVRARTGSGLAKTLGVDERAIQRALKRTIGHGPKWVSRWVRLQEVARALSSGDFTNVATLAIELGYSDQAHLVNDFRGAAGVTPGEYVKALRRLASS